MSSKVPYFQGAVTLVLVVLILYLSSEFFMFPFKQSAPYVQISDASWKGWANIDSIFSLYVCLTPRALPLDDKPCEATILFRPLNSRSLLAATRTLLPGSI